MSHAIIESAALDAVKNAINKNDILFYATTLDEEKNIADCVLQAKHNQNSNDFPDFITNEGFIEHFSITSSKEDKKGSRFRKEESGFVSDFSGKENEFKEYMNNNPSFDEVKTVTETYHYIEPHSHENLVRSFFNNLKSHIESSNKYDGKKNVRIYLVEYDEFNLHMYVNYQGIKCNRSYGDLLFREKDTLYRLSRDKEMLNELYKYQQDVDYIIFKSLRRIEIINVKEIPEIIKLIKYDYAFSEVVAYKMMSTHCISVKKE